MLYKSTTDWTKVVAWLAGSLIASYVCGSTFGLACIIAILVVSLGFITGLQKVEVVEHKGKTKASFKTRVDNTKKVPKQQWRK